MRLSTRLFLLTSLLVVAAVGGLLITTQRVLRTQLEDQVWDNLEHHARALVALLPADSARWPEVARTLGAAIGRRISLIGPDGRVLGDTDFDRTAVARLENHASRPEVRAAMATGVGRGRRRSASNNERQLYVAVRGGPPGISVIRVSSAAVEVDARVNAVQRGVAWLGLLAVVAAALLAWPISTAFARPLRQLTSAARRIAAGEEPEFPTSRVPEIADHAMTLRHMAEHLAARFQALQAEQQETHTLIESMTDGVIAADSRGDIGTCNTAARRLLGYSGTDTLPPLGELFHDKRGRDLLRDALAGRDVEQQELHREDRVLLVTARVLPTDGVLLMLRDVTAIRRLEAMRRDFVANVSHELKTPLTSIAGYAETLAAEPKLDEQAHSFAATIMSNAKRMQQLVDDLLDLSRIESGGWQPQRRVVELQAAVREAWAPFADDAARRKISFETRLAPSAHAVVADPAALRQILVNLFENAVRHTRSDGSIRVEASHAPAGVALWISDTGSGIAPEHLPRIFERFYRVDLGRGRDTGGTGLGLAIVKHLVEAHGGRVEAESTLGDGTTVRMTFPAEQLPSDPTSSSGSPPLPDRDLP